MYKDTYKNIENVIAIAKAIHYNEIINGTA